MLGLGSIGGKLRGAPEGAHAAAIAEGLGHLRKARFELDIRPGSTPMFHAGSSESWPGLQKAGGLIPGMNLKQEGIEVAAGEGLFSSIRRHSDVCVGQGAEGFGTARVYFDRLNESPRFSIRNYSDAQLERELSHFEEVERGEARSHLGLHRNRERNPTGFEQRLRLLRAERQHREGSGTPHYPVLFVFHHERLNPSPYVGGHYSAKLPGERWIQSKIPLDQMTYFAVPARHLEHAKGQLETIVPNAGDRVIPIEAFDALAEGRKDIARAKTSVKRILQSNEAIDWIRVNARVPGSWTSAFVGPARKPA